MNEPIPAAPLELWVIELRGEPGGTKIPEPLFLMYGVPEEMARRVIKADDAGVIGIGSAWTQDLALAAKFKESNAKTTANALDRCCQGVAVAVKLVQNEPDTVADEPVH